MSLRLYEAVQDIPASKVCYLVASGTVQIGEVEARLRIARLAKRLSSEGQIAAIPEPQAIMSSLNGAPYPRSLYLSRRNALASPSAVSGSSGLESTSCMTLFGPF